MIVISEEQKNELRKHVDNLDQLIEADDFDELLLAIDQAIVYNFDENDEPDAMALKIQRIYDDIYNAN